MKNPLEVRPEGLYCKPGDFYIDAWSPVKQCLVTHAHGDHARFGHQHYISSEITEEIIKLRLGTEISTTSISFDKKIRIKDCWVSLHPAGHILGSSQIRIETPSCVCVVSGDYKRVKDVTCEPFSLQCCDIFVTESTFALPVYNWNKPENIALEIYEWWQENRSCGFASILFCYALGKAQRVLSLLKQFTSVPLYAHGAILSITDLYRQKGIDLATCLPISENTKKDFSDELILAPPLMKGNPWMKRFYPYKTGLVSGWMQVRGIRKRKNLDRGFVISDHADWSELLATVKETGASKILTTHGNAEVLAKYLREQGIDAYSLSGMEWIGEGEGQI